MNRKTLIVVTLLFLLVIGVLLFFTILDINQNGSESFKSNGITASTVSYDTSIQVVQKTSSNDDYIEHYGCGK